MRLLTVFRIEKYVGPARGPARLLHSVHLEGVHRLLLLPCASRTIHHVHLELVDRMHVSWYLALKNAPGLPAGRPGGLAYHRASPGNTGLCSMFSPVPIPLR